MSIIWIGRRNKILSQKPILDFLEFVSLKSTAVDRHFGVRKAVVFSSKARCRLFKLDDKLKFIIETPFGTLWRSLSPWIKFCRLGGDFDYTICSSCWPAEFVIFICLWVNSLPSTGLGSVGWNFPIGGNFWEFELLSTFPCKFFVDTVAGCRSRSLRGIWCLSIDPSWRYARKRYRVSDSQPNHRGFLGL